MAKRGAKPKYNKEMKEKAAKLARAGARDKEIAKKIGISVSTLTNYKKKYPELLASLKAEKDEVDKEVACALLRNALGYTITETKRFFRPLFKSNGEPVLDRAGNQIKALLREEVTEKEVQPNTTAQIFWLKNRQPQEWRQNVTQTDWENAKGEIVELFSQIAREGTEKASASA